MKRRGFTLIELIIVVIILGILAAVGIPQYMRAIERARGAEGYAGLGYIQQGEKVYFATMETYFNEAPLTDAGEKTLDISLPQTGWTFGIASADPLVDFTATATRVAGQCATKVMTVDQQGVLLDNDWRSCVDAL